MTVVPMELDQLKEDGRIETGSPYHGVLNKGVPAVPVSFDNEADESDEEEADDDNDGEDTKKLASPSASNKKDESSNDNDGFYGDIRNNFSKLKGSDFKLPVIDFLKLKWSDFSFDSNNEASGKHATAGLPVDDSKLRYIKIKTVFNHKQQ